MSLRYALSNKMKEATYSISKVSVNPRKPICFLLLNELFTSQQLTQLQSDWQHQSFQPSWYKTQQMTYNTLYVGGAEGYRATCYIRTIPTVTHGQVR